MVIRVLIDVCFFSDGLGVIEDPFEIYESISSSLFYNPDGQADTEPHEVPVGHGDRPHLADQCDSGHPGNSCGGHSGDGLVGEERAGYVHVGDEQIGVDPVHVDQQGPRAPLPFLQRYGGHFQVQGHDCCLKTKRI